MKYHSSLFINKNYDQIQIDKKFLIFFQINQEKKFKDWRSIRHRERMVHKKLNSELKNKY